MSYISNGTISIYKGTAPAGLSASLTTGGTIPLATYNYKVAAVFPSGESLPSSAANATVANSTNDAVYLTWTAVTGATSYKVYRKASGDATYTEYLTTTNNYITDTNQVRASGSPQSIDSVSNKVVGSGTTFLTGVTVGNSFKVRNDPVIYQVASITDDTNLTLSVAYAANIVVNSQYQICNYYTPTLGLAEIDMYTADWPHWLTTEVIRRLDQKFTSGTASGLDVDKVDGYDASTDPTASQIPVKNASNNLVMTTGNVGIGTATPTAKLEVVTSVGESTLKVWSSTNTSPVASIELQRGTNSTWGADAYGDYKISNNTGNLVISYGESAVTSEKLRITSSGTVFLGGATGAETTNVNGFGINSPSGLGGIISYVSAGSTARDHYTFKNTVTAGIDSGNLVGSIGTTNNNLYVNIPSGALLVGTTSGTYHKLIHPPTTLAGNPVCAIAGGGIGYGVIIFEGGNTGAPNAANAVVKIGNMATAGRSINTAGTINASGADYAEYEYKALTCTEVAPGQIVGFDSDGLLTDKWADAISFGVKSTAPSYVGGDTWGSTDIVGERPEEPVLLEGEGTEEYDLRVVAYEDALVDFNHRLEVERQKVDRIAYSGKVPCNVIDAAVGDYIVAVQVGDGIGGVSVTNPSFEQYKLSVGRVRRILPDGRPEIAVIVH